MLERRGPEAKPAVPTILQLLKEDQAKKASSNISFAWQVKDEEDKQEDENTIFRRSTLAALRRIDPEIVQRVSKEK